MFAESGLQMALIQKKETDNKDYSTVFWFSLSVGIFFYIIIFLFAGNIAAYFDEPQLKDIARVVSLSLIIGPLGGIQLCILSKAINFKKQAKISFVATIFSGITGVILALKGFAVWALVFQTLSGSLISTGLLWIKSSWKPAFIFDIDRFKQLYHYGWKIFLQGLSNAIFTNLYFPLIGKYYSTADLGFYTRGKRFYDMFIHQATISYGRVTFPVFSSIQYENDRLSRSYLQAYNTIIVILIPLATILILITEPFIKIFLTEKWMPSVPYIQLFLSFGYFFPIYMLNLNIISSKGRSDIVLYTDISNKILLAFFLILTINININFIITGQLLALFLSTIISFYFIRKIVSINLFYIIREYFQLITISGIIYLIIFFSREYIYNEVLQLILFFILPAFFYYFIYYLFKLKSFYTVKIIIKDVLKG